MERKLVTYRTVKEIKPIEGADFIELAIVDGWQCVVKKGEFKVGDMAVYFEVDSILPVKPQFEFLRKSSYRKFEDGTEGFRLKTIKLKKQISQGLLLPISSLNITMEVPLPDPDTLTEYFSVIKYEQQVSVSLAGHAKGNFPEFIPKTDQERIQNLSDYPERYKGCQWEVTEKIDGTSCTVYHKDDDVGVCSRNLDLKEDENNTYWKIIRENRIIEKLLTLNRNLAFQGEICGMGIQKNRLKLSDLKFYLFDIYDIDNQCYLSPTERLILARNLGIDHVPLLVFTDMRYSVEDILKEANGFSALNNKEIREGTVWKFAMQGQDPISFKAISNEYLLKHGI
jgi:RNA ligase (TIGR02306 family)